MSTTIFCDRNLRDISPQEFWVPVFDAVKYLEKNDAGEQNGQNRHQHFKPVTITYRLKYKRVIQAGYSFELFSLELTAF